MSDYTPLSLAASGGYVGIIKTLLQYGAEINSRSLIILVIINTWVVKKEFEWVG